jgi:hypothetical protein
MRTTTSKKQDTRQPNQQPNHLQPTLAAVIGYAGNTGTVQVPQNDKLSAAGNVTYQGGIRKGWLIDGEPVDVLGTVTAEIEGVVLTRAAAGVHASQAGNPTVCLTALIPLPSAQADEPVRYQVQVWITYRVKHGDYTLSISGQPFGLKPGQAGPQVRGDVAGFELVTA